MSSADNAANRECLDATSFDAIIYRFEDAWQSGTPPTLEECLPQQFDRRRELLEELVQIEWEYRLKAGDSPSVEQYRSRFPELFDETDLEDRLTAVQQDLEQRPPDAARQQARLAANFRPGSVLGNYTILAPLGQGAAGFVYKAQHRTMKRVVALKVIVPNSDWTGENQKRFRREIETVARLSHPNIVTGYDADEVGDVHYLAMELIVGIDLARLVQDSGPLSVENTVDYVTQAAGGLAYAHREGIVHRDVKPGNLIVNAEGVVKVLDLGMARWKAPGDSVTSALTRTGQVFGTVDFLAPEQAVNSKNADARSDIYSLGCTMWFLLTGTLLYKGSLMQRVVSHGTQPIPSLCEANPAAPPSLEAVFSKMVAKSPDARYQSMSEVVVALDALLPSGDAASAAASADGASPTIATRTKHETPRTRVSLPPMLWRWLVAVIGGTIAFVGLALWWSAIQRRPAKPASAPAAAESSPAQNVQQSP